MVINIFAAVLMVSVFAVLLHVVGLVERTKEVVSIGRRAAAILRDATRPDAEKEREMQQNSLQLFRLLAILILGTAIALAVPVALIWLGQIAGLLSLVEVLRLFLRWDFLVGATVLGIAAYIASVKWLNRSS